MTMFLPSGWDVVNISKLEEARRLTEEVKLIYLAILLSEKAERLERHFPVHRCDVPQEGD